jgi:hypothetical protein
MSVKREEGVMFKAFGRVVLLAALPVTVGTAVYVSDANNAQADQVVCWKCQSVWPCVECLEGAIREGCYTIGCYKCRYSGGFCGYKPP